MKITKMSRVIFPRSANHKGHMFGGEMLSWMDEVAGVAAGRFAGGEVTTAAAEQIRFYRPVPVGAVVDVTGEVIHVGNSSMKIRSAITMDAPEESGEVLMAEGLFIYVAIDENGRPRKVGRKLGDEESAARSI